MNFINPRISLWFYVFLLLGGFLLLVALTQLFFIHHIERRINEEISDKSSFLVNRALELVIDNEFKDNAELPEIIKSQQRIEIESISDLKALQKSLPTVQGEISIFTQQSLPKIPTNENETIDDGREDEAQNNESMVVKKLEAIINKGVELEEQEKRLQATIERIKDSADKVKVEATDKQFIIFSPTSSHQTQQSTLFIDNKQGTVTEYFSYLTWGTLASALLSLCFAFWLSRHVTSPLRTLSAGFTRLSQGELGFTLESKGVKEVQQTLEQFNETSIRLKALQDKEQHFSKQQHLSELGEVSRGLAHSLRNPLNTIGLALEEIAQQSLSDEQRLALAEQARTKIKALDKTIKSLLLLTTSGIDRQQLVDLNNLVSDVVMQGTMHTECEVDINAQQNITVRGSELELYAVLSSLLSNAQEASQVPYKIQFNLVTTKDQAIVSIIDEGSGLDDSIKEDLFKPHITSKAEGAGMGLYIAKRILNLHYDGDLIISNNKHKGCTATISLPFQKTKPEGEQDIGS